MVVPQAGAKFNLEKRDLREPDRHEVRIKIHARGVCHSDSATVLGAPPRGSSIRAFLVMR
jgi:alcohol dehydrogenase